MLVPSNSNQSLILAERLSLYSSRREQEGNVGNLQKPIFDHALRGPVAWRGMEFCDVGRAYHGFILSVHRVLGSRRKLKLHANDRMWSYMVKAFIMFQLTSFGWIFFRGQSEESKIRYLRFWYLPVPAKNFIYGILTYLLCLYGAKAQSFIYFQF